MAVFNIGLKMAQKEKLTKRVLSIPSDLTWQELSSFLSSLGYQEEAKEKTGGSRRRFANKKTGLMMNLHKPHPSSIVKKYAIRQVIEELKMEKIL